MINQLQRAKFRPCLFLEKTTYLILLQYVHFSVDLLLSKKAPKINRAVRDIGLVNFTLALCRNHRRIEPLLRR